MASYDSRESSDYLQKCPYCDQTYKNPILLKCGHQMCLLCAEEATKTTTDLICIICKIITRDVDVDELPTSELHRDLVNSVFTSVKKKGKCDYRCLKCKTQKATKHCRDCGSDLSDLCESCFRHHQQLPR